MSNLKKELESKGYKLRRVIHLRNIKEGYSNLPRFAPDYAIKAMGLGSLIDPRGGSTIAIVQKDGKTVEAIAECHSKDGYNKKQGKVLAVERALAMFNLA